MNAVVPTIESPATGLRGLFSRPGTLLRQAPRAIVRLPLAVAGRVWHHPRLRLVVLLVLLLTPIPAYCLGVIVMRPKPPKVTLAAALAALDAGDDALAAYHAKRLFEAEIYAPWNHGGPAYVLGILAARRGEQAEGPRQHNYRVLAVSYLREARQQGFLAGRERHGLFTLGATLARLGRHAESIEPLRDALAVPATPLAREQADAEHDVAEQGASAHGAIDHLVPAASEIHRLLSTAYQRLPKPRLADALEQNAHYLADHDLSIADRQQGVLERAHIQFEFGQAAACRETLAQITPESEQSLSAQLLEARLLLREARELGGAPAQEIPVSVPSSEDSGAPATSTPSAPSSAHDAVSLGPTKTAPRPKPTGAALEQYRRAMASLEQVRGRDSLAADVPLDALYLLGECRLEMGDEAAAYQLFREVAQRGTREAAIAPSELRRAELLLRQGQPTEAMLAMQPALRLAQAPEEYENSWLPRTEFRARVTAFHAELLDGGQLGLAVNLAKQAYPLFARDEQTRLLAETHRACAQRLEEGRGRHGEHGGSTHDEARQHYRHAAEAFYRLARLEYATPCYPDHLWSAAQCYQSAGEVALAEPLLRAYLSHDVSRQVRPQALLRLAQVQIAQGRPRGATATLRQLRDEFPRDPIVYSARLLAADAHLALEEHDEARRALQANLDGGELTPASDDWRDSLFALGRLHALRQELPETIKVLEEAVARYPQAPHVIQARYLISEAYQRRAKERAAKSRAPSDEQRQAHERRHQADLEASLASLRQIAEAGAARDEGLDELDRLALRSASFAQVNVLIELGRHEEAVRACAAVINRYHDAPEILEAYVQIAAGLRRLKRADEALAALAQARTVLDKLPADASFARTTNPTKEDWRRYLEWLAKN